MEPQSLPTVLNDANEAAAWRETIQTAVWRSVGPNGRWPESRHRYNPFQDEPRESLMRLDLPSFTGPLPAAEPPAAGWGDLDVQETYLLARNGDEASRRLVRAERIATSGSASTSERRKAASQARFLRGYIESANQGVRESSKVWLPQLTPFAPKPKPTPAPQHFVGAW